MSNQPAISESDVIDGLNVNYFKLYGMWKIINDYRTTGKRNSIMKYSLIGAMVLGSPYIFSQFLCYFVMKLDIQKVAILNLHMLPALQTFGKVLFFWFRVNSQSRLFSLTKKDFLNIPLSKRAEVGHICKTIMRKTNMFCISAFIVNGSIAILNILCPGVSVDYILYHTGNMAAVTGGRKKILRGWYPIPMGESPYYELIFLYEAVLILWGGILLGVYACLFYIVLMCLYAQFCVLNYHISTLRMDSYNKKKKGESIMLRELCDIIQDHQKLLSYAGELRSVYNPLVTMILGTGIIMLIISIFEFLLGGSNSLMFIFKSMQYLAYQGIEVFMFCLGSSYIETASSDLQLAIYSSDWYKADIKFQKMAQMLMVSARKGVTLTAIRMYPVNVETIMAIFQFAYSVSALLSRKIEQK